MSIRFDSIHFTPADKAVELHWAVTGLLARAHGARHGYGVVLDGGSIDVYFTDDSFEPRYGTAQKVIWADTRPAIIKANNSRPLIFFSDILQESTIRNIINTQLTDKSIASLYYSLLTKLKATGHYTMIHSDVWHEYRKMYPDLDDEAFCECESCQADRKQKEIDALILPIKQHLQQVLEQLKKERQAREEQYLDEYIHGK